MKMKKLMHHLGHLGLRDTVGLGIQIIMVSAHMIFIMEISEAKVQYSLVFFFLFTVLDSNKHVLDSSSLFA